LSRRAFLLLSAGGAAGLGAGCASGAAPRPWTLDTHQRRLVDARRDDFEIVVRGGGPGSAVLRRLARPVPAGLDLRRVAERMARTMRRAKGVGLAGPQVGLALRIATLMLDYKTHRPRTVFVRNPVIVERADQVVEGYEGCLSIPGVGGLVKRHAWITVQHADAAGRLQRTTAHGPNAVLWQHELDHLDGVLYIDKLQGQLLPMDEVRRRREELERKTRSEKPLALDRLPRHREAWLL